MLLASVLTVLRWQTAPEPAPAAPVTRTFGYAGSPQTWTVPAGVTNLSIVASGGAGGDGGIGGGITNRAGGVGGRGMRVTVPSLAARDVWARSPGPGDAGAAGPT